MTPQEADAIELGKKWYDTTTTSPRQSLVGCEVISSVFRNPITAYLSFNQFAGAWRFLVNASRPPAGTEPEQGHFDTPEQALEGLKAWRRAHLVHSER